MSSPITFIITLVALVASLLSRHMVSLLCRHISTLARLSSATFIVLGLGLLLLLFLLLAAGATLPTAASVLLSGPVSLLSATLSFGATVFGAFVHVDRQRSAGLWLVHGFSNMALTALIITWAVTSGPLASASAPPASSADPSAPLIRTDAPLSSVTRNGDDPHNIPADSPRTPHLSPSTSVSSFADEEDLEDGFSDGDFDDGETPSWTMTVDQVQKMEEEHQRTQSPDSLDDDDLLNETAPAFGFGFEYDDDMDYEEWQRERFALTQRDPPTSTSKPFVPTFQRKERPPFSFSAGERAMWKRQREVVQSWIDRIEEDAEA